MYIFLGEKRYKDSMRDTTFLLTLSSVFIWNFWTPFAVLVEQKPVHVYLRRRILDQTTQSVHMHVVIRLILNLSFIFCNLHRSPFSCYAKVPPPLYKLLVFKFDDKTDTCTVNIFHDQITKTFTCTNNLWRLLEI